MKFAQSTLLAILATSALVSAAPATVNAGESTTLMVRRGDANQILDILSELESLKSKRDVIQDEASLMELERRADDVLSNLIEALASSGLISKVISDLTSNSELKTSIVAIVKSAIQEAVVQGPTLLKGIWNSGLIQDTFSTILDDSDLRSALLAAGKSLFGTAESLLSAYLGKSSGTTTAAATTATTTATSTATAAAKRETEDDDDILSTRDLSSIVSSVISVVENSGLVTTLINKITADPEAFISFLSTALKEGVVLLKDVYSWAKDNGLLADALSWLEGSSSGIVAELGKFLAEALDSGSVSSSEINSASTTATATTATAAAAVTTTAAVTATTTDLSFLSKYATAGATTLYRVKRMAY
ncbi:hypothetical protein PSN45_001737 [Yamadazyma tenuis]|uniref:uncharacterized protein n=1 Tax=Candida tenuis TaxID=2315449 RepID=UPI0027A9C250|nr:hypothetical protein PSN45_001737 [Yamadazyma tenuis]